MHNCVVRNYKRPHNWLFFFENAEGFTETVNGEGYWHILNTFLKPVVIHLHNRHELWFQQDRVTCHTANKTMDVLQGMFGKNIIFRQAALTWLTRSPGLYMLQTTFFEDI